MPLLKILTNQTIEETRQTAFLEETSQLVAGMLGKPERYVMVSIEHSPLMMFAGSSAPLAYLELKSISLPDSKTSEFSQTLANLLEQELGLPADRVYIEFVDAPRNMWGWNGATF